MGNRRYERSLSDRANAIASTRTPAEPSAGDLSSAAWDRGAEMIENGREAMHETRDMIARHPVVAVVACFGAGFGLGVLATLALSGERESSTASWLRRHHLPDSVSDSWNQMSSGLKRVPGMIAEHLPSGFASR